MIYFDQFYAASSSISKPTAITNFTHYGENISGVDELLAKATYNPNAQEQISLWQEAQKKIARDVIAIPLYTQYYAMARSKALDLGHEQKSFIFYQITEATRVLVP